MDSPALPLVSIITITRNSEKYLADAIHSVLAQDYSNLEYLIVDGESEDQTLTIARSFNDPRIKILSTAPRGISDAMNFGIKAARGEIIGILHSDDLYMPTTVSKAVHSIIKTGSQWCYGQMDYIDCNGEILYRVGVPFTMPRIKRFMMINHPTVFCRASLYKEMGTFENCYKVAMDYDLALRFALKYAPLYISEPLARMRLGGLSSGPYRPMMLAAKETLQIKFKLLPSEKWNSFREYIWSVLKINIKFLIRHLPLNKILTNFVRPFVNPNFLRSSK